MGRFSPSVGEPGYLPYCSCPTMRRCVRDEVKKTFVCTVCKSESRIINGEDMFDRTAPLRPQEDPRP